PDADRRPLGDVPFEPRLQRERLPVAGELQVAAPDGSVRLNLAYRTLPIQHADAGACIELLIVDEWLEHALQIAGANGHCDGVLDLRARRAPAADRTKLDLAGLEYAHAAVGRTIAATGPE